MKVLKFGGSSVGSPETIKQVIDIVNKQEVETDFFEKDNIQKKNYLLSF